MLGVVSMTKVAPENRFEEPIFEIKYDIVNLNAGVRLNDIPVLEHDSDGKTSSRKPVPESIVDGKNILTAHISPSENSEEFMSSAYLDIALIVREQSGAVNSGETLMHIHVDPAQGQDNVVSGSSEQLDGVSVDVRSYSDREINVSSSVSINSPFPRWAWQDGQDIERSKENHESLKKVYVNLYRALDQENKEKIFRLYEAAAKEFAYAYHYSDPSHGHRIMNTAGLMGDDYWELGDTMQAFENIEYNLEVFANGKLAHFVDEDGDSPIAYFSSDGELTNFQKFAFYKNDKNEWVMIR